MPPRRSALSELLKVQQYLASKGLGFVVPRLVSPTSGVLVVEVSRDRIHATASAGHTSRRQLSFLSKSLEAKFGRRVLVTIRDAQPLDDVAASLRAVLRREFPGVVSDVHVSFEDAGTALVWVEVSTLIEAATLDAARTIASRELVEFGVVCKSFDVVAPVRPEPSTVAILRSVKVLAPVLSVSLAADLDRRGFSYPSEKWLSHKLDVARKRGFVSRDPQGRFSLTAEGLSVVPTSRSGSSSDVERMLAVARRKEW